MQLCIIDDGRPSGIWLYQTQKPSSPCKTSNVSSTSIYFWAANILDFFHGYVLFFSPFSKSLLFNMLREKKQPTTPILFSGLLLILSSAVWGGETPQMENPSDAQETSDEAPQAHLPPFKRPFSLVADFGQPQFSANESGYDWHFEMEFWIKNISQRYLLTQNVYRYQDPNPNNPVIRLYRETYYQQHLGKEWFHQSGAGSLLNIHFAMLSTLNRESKENSFGYKKTYTGQLGLRYGHSSPRHRSFVYDWYLDVSRRKYLLFSTNLSLPSDIWALFDPGYSGCDRASSPNWFWVFGSEIQSSSIFSGNGVLARNVIENKLDLIVDVHLSSYKTYAFFFSLNNGFSLQDQDLWLVNGLSVLRGDLLILERLKLIPNLYIELHTQTLMGDTTTTTFNPIYGIGIYRGLSIFKKKPLVASEKR